MVVEIRDYPEIPEVVTLLAAPEEHRHPFGTGEKLTRSKEQEFLPENSDTVPVELFKNSFS